MPAERCLMGTRMRRSVPRAGHPAGGAACPAGVVRLSQIRLYNDGELARLLALTLTVYANTATDHTGEKGRARGRRECAAGAARRPYRRGLAGRRRHRPEPASGTGHAPELPAAVCLGREWHRTC